MNLFSNLFLLADAGATGETAQQGGIMGALMSFLPLILIVVLMYFMMIRPQKKRQKEEEKMRNNLQIGDEILTIGGFYFKVVSIKEDSLVVESTADHSKHRVAKWAVQQNMTIHDEA